MPELPTGGSASGSSQRGRHIPTPTVFDAHPVSKPRRITTEDNFRGVSLGYLVEHEPQKMWPTPAARDYKGAYSEQGLTRKDGKSRMDQLANAVRYGRHTFPTPNCHNMGGTSGNRAKLRRLKGEGILNEEERRSMDAGNGGKLNPRWEEWLMGWPPGWTDLAPMDKADFEAWREAVLDGTFWDTDPAELPSDDAGYIPRTEVDVPQRVARIIAIGNGQVPMCILLFSELLAGVPA